MIMTFHRVKIVTVLLAILLYTIALPSFATTYYVDGDNGSDYVCCRRWIDLLVTDNGCFDVML